MTEAKKDPEIIPFETSKSWLKWLSKNHKRQEGIWLKLFKKGSGVQSITYMEALEGALCYGWIDGQLKSLDEKAYLQKFTPRRARSLWSKRNRDIVAKLIDDKLMQPAGMAEIEAAKEDGRWDAAYDGQRSMKVPDDFMKALAKDPAAKKFFGTLDRANIYAIVWRLQTARTPSARQKRFDTLLAMLSRREKLH